MEYFQLFGIEPHFNIDLSALKKKYYALSRNTHPDFFTLETATQKAESLSDSTTLNQAYKTLRDPNKRLKYILEQEGLVLEGKGAQMPQHFLMEMMDINEAIMELQFDPDPSKLEEAKKDFNEKLATLESIGDTLKTQYDSGTNQENLAALKDYYFKKKYMVRMRENLEGQAGEI